MKAGKWAATKFIKALLPSQPLGNQNYNELKKQNMKTATCCPTKKGQTTKRMNPRHKRSTTTLSGCVLEAPAPGPDPGASAPPSWALPSRTSGEAQVGAIRRHLERGAELQGHSAQCLLPCPRPSCVHRDPRPSPQGPALMEHSDAQIKYVQGWEVDVFQDLG